jgi:hypothetical protein
VPRPDGVPRPRALPPARDDGVPPWQSTQAPQEAVPARPAPSAGPQLGTSAMPGIVNQADVANQGGTGTQPPAGPAGSTPLAQDPLTMPPWSRLPAELAAATAPADFPEWSKGTGSGPMYVWDPSTNSGPFPALDPGDE